jgi:hypothetical protein
MSDVISLLGPILGKIYSSHDEESFGRLPFSESALEAIREAGEFYNSGRRDHALIEMFKEIEKVLRDALDARGVSVDKPEAAGYIHALKEAGLITECDLHILNALRCYRNLGAHPTGQFQHSVADALLILTVPMLSRLETQLRV